MTRTASTPPTARTPGDVLVWANGFHVTDPPFVDIKGADGEDLVDRWNAEGMAPTAHHLAGMPSVLPAGPNTASAKTRWC